MKMQWPFILFGQQSGVLGDAPISLLGNYRVLYALELTVGCVCAFAIVTHHGQRAQED